MAVAALKPNFTDRDSYLSWRMFWKIVYRRITHDIRKAKRRTRYAQMAGVEQASAMQRELFLLRRDACRLMTLLDEAYQRRDRIMKMRRDIEEQPFPLEIKDCRSVDFHWNKVCLKFPFMPPWVILAKGKQWLVNEINSDVGFEVRNTPNKSTKGSVRVRNVSITISANGCANINRSG